MDFKNFSTVKKVTKSCYLCKRFNARNIKVNTNDYKEWFVTTNRRLYDKCFIDVIGPYFAKYGNEKRKIWILIFKCTWSKSVNLEVMIDYSSESVLTALQNHFYEYGIMNMIISDSGSNFQSTIPKIQDIFETFEVKEYLDQFSIKFQYIVYPKGSLNRGIGGFIERGVKTIKKLIYGAIINNVVDFVKFCSIIKQCKCFANKRPLSDNALLRQNDNNENYSLITPEIIKFGYDLCVIDVDPTENNDEWNQINDIENSISVSEIQKIVKIKDKIRTEYNDDFIYSLIDLATKNKEKYKSVVHTKLSKNDIVLIRDDLVKTVNHPLGVVVDVKVNSNNEVTSATILKANKQIIKRDVSSLALLVKSKKELEITKNPNSFVANKNETNSIDKNQAVNDVNISDIKSKRKAAIKSKALTKEMLQKGEA